jgi:hypothetical protein
MSYLSGPPVIFLNFHTFIFEKLILPTMSKIAKFGKKTQGILGVKLYNCFVQNSNLTLQ